MYGREGELARLKKDINNPKIHKFHRQYAHRMYVKITKQMKDRKLMRLRWQLLNANRAKDAKYVDKLVLQMRDYEKEIKESGL